MTCSSGVTHAEACAGRALRSSAGLVAIPASGAPVGRPAGDAGIPLSQAATIHEASAQTAPLRRIAALAGRLRRGHSIAPSQPASPAPARGLAADVFNHDTVGFPQNEESVAACGRTVLGGTN